MKFAGGGISYGHIYPGNLAFLVTIKAKRQGVVSSPLPLPSRYEEGPSRAMGNCHHMGEVDLSLRLLSLILVKRYD